MTPIARIVIVGQIGAVEQKSVNGKQLAETRIDGLGLRINAWGDLAKSVRPGITAVIEGAVKTRSYQAQGQDRTTTEITASSVVPLDTAEVDDDDSLGF